MSQYPPPKTAKAGSPAPMRGAGTSTGVASAGSIDATTTPSAASAMGATKFSLVIISPVSASRNSPSFGDGADSTTMSLANLQSNAPKGAEGDIKQRFIGHVAFQQQLDGDIEWNK
jgi:hypothetical protein